jgi:hypothetical protein
MRKLTARQEKFCQGIADGQSYSDAYRNAYNAVNISNKSVWERSSRIADNSKVNARIAELKAKLEKKQLWTKEMSVNILGSIALKAAFDNNKIAAIKELNAMHGFNEPTKIELNNLPPMTLVLNHGVKHPPD